MFLLSTFILVILVNGYFRLIPPISFRDFKDTKDLRDCCEPFTFLAVNCQIIKFSAFNSLPYTLHLQPSLPSVNCQPSTNLHPKLYNDHRYSIHAGGDENTDGGFIKPLVYIISENNSIEKKWETYHGCKKTLVLKGHLHKIYQRRWSCFPKIKQEHSHKRR